MSEHFAALQDDGRWGCDGCDWTSAKIENFWKTHETRRHDDNIPF